MPILQCPKLTTLDAVATDHAAQGIYGVRLIVYAGGLTVLRTQRAVLALVHIEMYLQPRELRKDAQRSTYRTDGVAIGTTIAPGEHSQYDQSHDANDEAWQGTHPDVRMVERIAVVVLGNGCQHVVACHPYRL